jgi:hypothetical protein
MRRLHPLFGLLLAALLSLTSVTVAVARTQAMGATEMVICSGYGVVTVTLDANGNPTGPVHPCPDCLAGVTAFLVPSHPAPALRPATRAEVLVPLAPPAHTDRLAPPAAARGPPLPV